MYEKSVKPSQKVVGTSTVLSHNTAIFLIEKSTTYKLGGSCFYTTTNGGKAQPFTFTPASLSLK